jgi:hypothetical protein
MRSLRSVWFWNSSSGGHNGMVTETGVKQNRALVGFFCREPVRGVWREPAILVIGFR